MKKILLFFTVLMSAISAFADDEQTIGDVVVQEDGNIDILNLHGVKLAAGFCCELGGRLKIHN